MKKEKLPNSNNNNYFLASNVGNYVLVVMVIAAYTVAINFRPTNDYVIGTKKPMFMEYYNESNKKHN